MALDGGERDGGGRRVLRGGMARGAGTGGRARCAPAYAAAASRRHEAPGRAGTARR